MEKITISTIAKEFDEKFSDQWEFAMPNEVFNFIKKILKQYSEAVKVDKIKDLPNWNDCVDYQREKIKEFWEEK